MLKHTGRIKSSDGATIAFEVCGSGRPAVILVDGALCFRHLGPSKGMSQMLIAEGFAVVRFDRRGRGDSTSTPSSSPAIEVDDIVVLVKEIGGEIALWGVSSGGLLALLAAERLSQIRRVAVYEAPVLFDRSHAPMTADWQAIDSLLQAGRLNEAVDRFLRMVGMPAPARAMMRLLPVWRQLRSAASTLSRDGAISGPFLAGSPDALSLLPNVTCQLLVTAGTRSPRWICGNNQRLADHYPQARFAMIEGDDHLVRPARHRNELARLFGENL